MPSELGKKGLEKGLITQNQYNKLPAHLVDAIVKKKMKDMPKKKAVKTTKKGKKGKKKK
jgi:hypothetical protein